MIPTKEENPNGLHAKYVIRKVVPIKNIKPNGKRFRNIAVDKDAEYFILRLDYNGKDNFHAWACREAVLHYAKIISSHLPELSKDIIERYGVKSIDESLPTGNGNNLKDIKNR